MSLLIKLVASEEKAKMVVEMIKLKRHVEGFATNKEKWEKERRELGSTLKSWKNSCFELEEKERKVITLSLTRSN